MRILHVGWGFSPWRTGGLIEYAEDVMAAQAARGHHVAYFLSGRHYPLARAPRLRRRRRGGVALYELVNAPVLAGVEEGTRFPEREIDEPETERAFAGVLAQERPDVVHVQELMGLPSSLLEVARGAGVPVLMTLQDYFPLCETARLLGRDCMTQDPGAGCVEASAGAPADAGPLVARTLGYELSRVKRRLPVVRRMHFSRRDRPTPPATGPPPGPTASADAYRRRREVNVERLRRVDHLAAMSGRVAAIYARLGAPPHETMRLTLAHIERLRPRRLEAPPEPVTFATLNGCAVPSKGSEVVLDALRRLRGRRFRLVVAGFVDPAIRDELRSFEQVDLRGPYERAKLDELLDAVDVGILPSIWEEAYAYTGAELLAKAIPVIANDRGGMAEHARGGATGWLNRSASGEELAAIMERLIDRPAEVVDRHRAAAAERPEPFAAHLDLLERRYAELVRRRSGRS